jgi:hypothetical protein
LATLPTAIGLLPWPRARALVERALDKHDIVVMTSRIRQLLPDIAAAAFLVALACGAGWVTYAALHAPD